MTSLSGIRVLVVDDQPEARLLICRALRLSGASFRTADSVDGALAAIAAEPPDLLISDLSMPQRDGYDLIRTLRDDGLALPAIAVSGHVEAEDADLSLRAGFQAYLGKPVNLRRLIDAAVALTSTVRVAP